MLWKTKKNIHLSTSCYSLHWNLSFCQHYSTEGFVLATMPFLEIWKSSVLSPGEQSQSILVPTFLWSCLPRSGCCISVTALFTINVQLLVQHISEYGAQRGGGLEDIKYEVSLAALCFTPTLVHISSTREAKDSLDVIHMRESVWLQARCDLSKTKTAAVSLTCPPYCPGWQSSPQCHNCGERAGYRLRLPLLLLELLSNKIPHHLEYLEPTLDRPPGS